MIVEINELIVYLLSINIILFVTSEVFFKYINISKIQIYQEKFDNVVTINFLICTILIALRLVEIVLSADVQ